MYGVHFSPYFSVCHLYQKNFIIICLQHLTNNPVTIGTVLPRGLRKFVERITALCGSNQILIAGISVP